jgi:hypothetical protein
MTMSRRRTRFATAALAAIALATLAFGSATAKSDFAAVRAATARFHSQSVAGEHGYGAFPVGAPLHECISNLNGPGAMGFHWLKASLLDGVLDPTQPEVLVYAPDADGDLQLVALEYVMFQSDWYANHPAGTMPSLFGQDLMVGDATRFQIPPFFALHVWLYRSNPSGLFASFNPNVSCGGTASAGAPNTASTGVAATLASASDTRRFACGIPGATA